MKKILLGLLALIAIIIAAAFFFFSSDSADPYADVFWGKFSGNCKESGRPADNFGNDFASCDYSVPAEEIPTFTEIPFPFTNIFDNTKSLPLMASALIDIDNDGVDEVFMGGGVTQEDALFKYTPAGFKDISAAVTLPKKATTSTTLGAVSFDLDKNGYNDLILSGDFGVYWYKNVAGKFTAHKLNLPVNEKSNPATITIADYNKDGHADIFLANYIRLDKMEGQTIFKDAQYGSSSLLFQNNGDNTFTDVTNAAGLAYIHNTFQGVFVDMNNDSWLDLVVAYDTGEARTYKNNGDGTYSIASNPMTGKYGYPMGIAVGDYNNDGLVDFFFSNTGSSVPEFLARGDLATEDVFIQKWILFKNEGNFKFTDAAMETNLADFEFSWGAVFQDFNLDGRQDLVVAENYVDFPPHQLFKLPCRFLVQRPNGTFAAVEDQAGAVNKNYAITPLTSDFNQDGYPDLIYTNLSGPVKALMNKGGDNHYLGVRFPETSQYVGTSIMATTATGKKISEVYVIGEGLGSDQTNTLTLGLGQETAVQSLTITYPSGASMTIDRPEIDKVHALK